MNTTNTDIIGSGTGENTEFPPVSSLNYEQARDELVEIVKILELGQMSLDQSLAYWERGEALAHHCEQHLAGATKRVEEAIARAQD